MGPVEKKFSEILLEHTKKFFQEYVGLSFFGEKTRNIVLQKCNPGLYISDEWYLIMSGIW